MENSNPRCDLSDTAPRPLSLGDIKFPKIWAGYIFAALFFLIARIPLIPGFAAESVPFILLPIVLLVILGSLVWWCVCVYKIHKILLKVTDNHYPISPARAVGFGFIPIYSFYWMFKWPGEIIRFINQRTSGKKIITWVPGLFLLSSSLLGRIDSTVSILLSFVALSYLESLIKRTLKDRPEILPYKDRPQAQSAAATVAIVLLCALPVFGLLAAVAIPNFIKAKAVATENYRRANLKQIDAATAAWAMDTGASYSAVPTWNDLVPRYLKSIPSDPMGGRYELGSASSPAKCITKENTVWTDRAERVEQQDQTLLN